MASGVLLAKDAPASPGLPRNGVGPGDVYLIPSGIGVAVSSVSYRPLDFHLPPVHDFANGPEVGCLTFSVAEDDGLVAVRRENQLFPGAVDCDISDISDPAGVVGELTLLCQVGFIAVISDLGRELLRRKTFLYHQLTQLHVSLPTPVPEVRLRISAVFNVLLICEHYTSPHVDSKIQSCRYTSFIRIAIFYIVIIVFVYV